MCRQSPPGRSSPGTDTSSKPGECDRADRGDAEWSLLCGIADAGGVSDGRDRFVSHAGQ